MAKARLLLSDVTVHVPDLERSIPPEYDASGAMIRGSIAAKPIPPLCIFEIDADEAETILVRHKGLRIPDNVVDAVAWARKKATELDMPASVVERIRLV